MAANNFTQIRNELNDIQSFGFTNIPLPPNPAVNDCWQWNTDLPLQLTTNLGEILDIGAGCPIFDAELQEYERFRPTSLLNHSFASTDVGRQFTNGMKANVQQFRIDCTRNPGKVASTKRSFLGMIYQANLKKIRLSEDGQAVVVNKTTGRLLPYDDMYNQPNLIRSIGGLKRSAQDLLDDINLNAERGVYGPGSERCRRGNCTVTGPCIDQSPIVEYGPGLFLHPRKRFTCASTNVVYLLYCNECLRLGRSSTYCGETDTADSTCHPRFQMHFGGFSFQNLRSIFPLNTEARVADFAEMVQGILGGNQDPHRVMQDPYTHFKFVHPPTNGNDHRRYVFLDGGFPTPRARKLCEMKYISFLDQLTTIMPLSLEI